VKLLLKILGLLGVLLLSLVAFVTFSYQPEAFPEGSRSAERLADGPWTVAMLDDSFVDRDRPTAANRDFAGSPERVLKGSVWYPLEAEVGPRPLLIFSHGFTSFRKNGAYLGEHLASHGFVVVSVDYPLTSMSAPGGPAVEDVVNQPGDISFLIDTLTGFSAVSGHPLSGKVDPDRVGVFGISLGGLTSTLAAFHPQWRDPRIGAAISIAGPTNFFTPRFFSYADTPFMMLAGDLDALVPYASNAAPVLEKVPGAALVTVRGGSHTGFSGGTALLRAMKNTDAIGCYSVLRYVDSDTNSQQAGLFGPTEDGYDYTAENELCQVDPLPKTMNVLRQQMVTRVVVRAFFEANLAAEPAVQQQAQRYLEQEIGGELGEVSYRQ
jgi:predicted dienelactone hydrolase